MKLLLINSAEPTIRKFITPLEEISKEMSIHFDVLEYQKLSSQVVNKYDGVIISGSPQGDDIIESHQAYFKWLKDFEKPILGICAGHHIVGYLFGAEIYRSKEIESGEIEINIIKKVSLFEGYKSKFKGIAMHNDSISVPDGFELIASTKTCMNEAMKKQDREWYTLQFHPEIQNHPIIINFINLVKDKCE
ncbi:MAG: gamma-glutamyl-gamma-aminobutyrate hydrolase family protein [Prolixibacteraceae bacterium]|jgi:GMP synthase (glutamine-hydrolysing)|nr:gamma-glutamyl-gamma-aminobutyrate hydrolase family protein [Prolixibacteraceae bacterium]